MSTCQEERFHKSDNFNMPECIVGQAETNFCYSGHPLPDLILGPILGRILGLILRNDEKLDLRQLTHRSFGAGPAVTHCNESHVLSPE